MLRDHLHPTIHLVPDDSCCPLEEITDCKCNRDYLAPRQAAGNQREVAYVSSSIVLHASRLMAVRFIAAVFTSNNRPSTNYCCRFIDLLTPERCTARRIAARSNPGRRIASDALTTTQLQLEDSVCKFISPRSHASMQRDGQQDSRFVRNSSIIDVGGRVVSIDLSVAYVRVGCRVCLITMRSN